MTVAVTSAGCLFPGVSSPKSELRECAPRLTRSVFLLLTLAVALAITVIAYRAIAQPLTGFDTAFRWDFLARQIVRERGFEFYPPTTDEDFSTYMWPEGIPPMVSLLYAWTYCGAGSTSPVLTAPLVLSVGLLAFLLVWSLAIRLTGRSAGMWACAILAGSGVHTWAVSMGQESGLLTVALLAMLFGLTAGRDGRPDSALGAIGAAVAALTRDYGVCAIGLGAVYLLINRRTWRELFIFLALSLLIAGPWYMRTWWITGNPMYNQDLFGLFPLNRMHAGLMAMYVDDLGFGTHFFERMSQLGSLLWPLGSVVLLAGMAGMLHLRTRAIALSCALVVWTALWIWSVGYTAGGMAYSLRVLCPALAVLAVSAGVLLSRVDPGWRSTTIAALLVLFAGDASIRALNGLAFPGGSAERWARLGAAQSAVRGDLQHDQMAKLVGASPVIVQSAYDHAFLVSRGVRVLPPWTPSLLFLEHQSYASAVEILNDRGVRFVLLSKSADLHYYFGQNPFFRDAPLRLTPVLTDRYWELFELRASTEPVDPRAGVPGSGSHR
ncbi:MAG: hypothetical protein ABIS43_21465 [Opitutus sp.]